MKISIYITIIASLIFGALTLPASARSDNAENFLLACRAYDMPFPPKHWDKYDIRDAAIEVLNEIEAGNDELFWATDFCLKALGYTQFPEDVDRILKYEDEMIYTVLRSLAGFPSEKAIECHLRWIDNEVGPKRELAIQGLAGIDYNELKEPQKWHNLAISELTKAKNREKVEWLKKEIDKSLTQVQAYKIKKAEKR